MAVPAFEEIEPASGCECPGCARWRALARSLPVRLGGHPAAHGARRALVLAVAAGAALAGAQAVPAAATEHRTARGAPADDGGDGPETPQGAKGPLHPAAGSPGKPQSGAGLPQTTRTDIIKRAKKWVTAKVPYSMSKYWSDGYRQDCSGFVSMAWNLGTNEWTGSLGSFGTKIKKDDLEPGDILLFHNEADPTKGSHVTIFGGWTDYTHTYYTAYEETPPHARKQSTPYAYWSNSDRYVPYRYKGISTGSAGAEPTGTSVAFPGAGSFGPGADNAYVTQLGEMLIARGGARFYPDGAGPLWSEQDRSATQAFQKAQGWTGAAADGIPGPVTWDYLVNHKGHDIPKASVSGRAAGAAAPGDVAVRSAAPGDVTARRAAAGGGTDDAARVPAFPGGAYFRPGQSNDWVALLGRQLARKRVGGYAPTGSGARWTDAERRAVEAFQRAQGWRGATADGYPGPETWRRLFS
ncbi:peptidoglycan-binding protein [Streptomyces sp. NPDC002004]